MNDRDFNFPVEFLYDSNDFAMLSAGLSDAWYDL
jgi:hypothetical protein